jgi:class 3 adenylate cyclase/tetratricopeptide (TPR) repeat protein
MAERRDADRPPAAPDERSALPATDGVPGGERRNATVLFADLSGYTELTERLDPEEVATLMNRVIDAATRIVEAHGGIVNQVVGDEVKALFGVPAAHEDDPARAVSSALALHELVRGIGADVERRAGTLLRFHTAINTGLVVTQKRDHREGHFGVTGDAINTAARLVTVAGPDEIVLGPATLALVQPYFVTEPLGSFSFRGKSRPLVVHRVRGRAARTPFEAAQRRGLSAYTGREREHARLDQALNDARAGRGRLIAVVGQPGLGKSRLLHEFRASIQDERTLVLEGRCRSYGSPAPYQPFLDALRSAFGIRDDDAPAQLQAKVVEGVRTLGGPAAENLPVCLHLLGAAGTEYPLPRSLHEDRLRRAILDALAALFLAHCDGRTVVLLLEDWHWADDASEVALRDLAALATQHQLLLLVTHRPHLRPSWDALRPLVLDLRPLDEIEVETITRSRFPGLVLPDGLVRFVHERTGGNPFFIEELCRTLTENRALVPAGDALRLAFPLEDVKVPETVQAAVRARIDRLPPPEAETLRLATVLGPTFAQRVLAHMAGDALPLDRTLGGLRDAELIDHLSPIGEPDPIFGFKHAITRDVAYDTLLLQQRRALHALAGAAIEHVYRDRRLADHYEPLVEHFAQAGDLERASHYAELAGDRAATTYVLAHAIRQYRRAIDLLEQLPQTAANVDRRVTVCVKWGPFVVYDAEPVQVDVLRRTYEEALAAGNHAGAARCVYWMGWLEHAMGNHTQAIAYFERTRALAEPLGDERVVAPLLGNLGQEHYHEADHQRAVRYLSGAITRRQQAPRTGPDVVVANSLGYLALCDAESGDFTEAFARIERALGMVRAAGARQVESTLLTILAWVHLFRGSWDGCLETGAPLREIADALGSTYVLCMAMAVEGYARCMRDADPQGLELLRDAIDRLEARHMRMALSQVYGCLAEATALAGNGEESAAMARRAIARSEVGDRVGEPQARRALGLARACHGDTDGALAALEEAIALARAGNRVREEAVTTFRLAEVLVGAGRRDAGTVTLAAVAERFERLGMPWYASQASRVPATRDAHDGPRSGSPR